jgi:hypothetical protein
MRESEEIQRNILALMNELVQAQEEEKKQMRRELAQLYNDVYRLNEKNKAIASILLED